MERDFQAVNIIENCRFLIFVTNPGEVVIKWCQTSEDLKPTTLAISGKDFFLMVEIIPKFKYLKYS